MHRFKNIKWMPLLMVLTIVGIAAFQYYWLTKAYEREERGLERQTNILFRETVMTLQATKLKLDRLMDTSKTTKLFVSTDASNNKTERRTIDPKVVYMLNVIDKMRDSVDLPVYIQDKVGDTLLRLNSRKSHVGKRDFLMHILNDMDSNQDSIKIAELDTAYARRLEEQNLDIPFTIRRVTAKKSKEPVFNEVTYGFHRPVTYRLDLGKTTGFLMMRIAVPILFSVFLIGFTLMSFTLLYRNLLKQQKLSAIKNEFISNITHELKTPIATVSVAIEALRSFNASMDPQKSKEYLDISANELQRLSMLVDKVLKLSMFEKKEIELKYEPLDMRSMIDEVTSSMRLQFEKHHAQVSVHIEGDTSLEGDHLHLVSVIFNLLDNALKYSNGQPKINLNAYSASDKLVLTIADNGIGIPVEYHNRIFEKFFRVPTGNLHNARGYGLGLSYVAHVINRHKGTIKVESNEGSGSRFVIQLPRHQVEKDVKLKNVA